jgi:hypothetical protein
MAVLTVQDIVQAGLAESFASAAALGDTFVDNGRQETFVEINNGSGGEIDVTINGVPASVVVAGVGPLTVPDMLVVVGAGARKLIGPFPSAYRTAAGVVSIAYEAVSSVTVRVLRCAKVDG